MGIRSAMVVRLAKCVGPTILPVYTSAKRQGIKEPEENLWYIVSS